MSAFNLPEFAPFTAKIATVSRTTTTVRHVLVPEGIHYAAIIANPLEFPSMYRPRVDVDAPSYETVVWRELTWQERFRLAADMYGFDPGAGPHAFYDDDVEVHLLLLVPEEGRGMHFFTSDSFQEIDEQVLPDRPCIRINLDTGEVRVSSATWVWQ